MSVKTLGGNAQIFMLVYRLGSFGLLRMQESNLRPSPSRGDELPLLQSAICVVAKISQEKRVGSLFATFYVTFRSCKDFKYYFICLHPSICFEKHFCLFHCVVYLLAERDVGLISE